MTNIPKSSRILSISSSDKINVIVTTFNLEKQSNNKLFGQEMKLLVSKLHLYNKHIICIDKEFKFDDSSCNLTNIANSTGHLFSFINLYTDAIFTLTNLELKRSCIEKIKKLLSKIILNLDNKKSDKIIRIAILQGIKILCEMKKEYVKYIEEKREYERFLKESLEDFDEKKDFEKIFSYFDNDYDENIINQFIDEF